MQAKKSVFRRDTREALWQLREYPRHLGGGDRVILAAEAISPGSKEFLRRENVGYFDMGGSFFIPVPEAYVLIVTPVPRNLVRSVTTALHSFGGEAHCVKRFGNGVREKPAEFRQFAPPAGLAGVITGLAVDSTGLAGG
ncbi:hypothetical protein ABIF97_004261 [Bradyrhizobium japonicum]